VPIVFTYVDDAKRWLKSLVGAKASPALEAGKP
jgi:hypothetical protein